MVPAPVRAAREAMVPVSSTCPSPAPSTLLWKSRYPGTGRAEMGLLVQFRDSASASLPSSLPRWFVMVLGWAGYCLLNVNKGVQQAACRRGGTTAVMLGGSGAAGMGTCSFLPGLLGVMASGREDKQVTGPGNCCSTGACWGLSVRAPRGQC